MTSNNEIYSDSKQINSITYKQDSQKVISVGGNCFLVNTLNGNYS